MIKCNCYRCNKHIDKTDCNISYGIITLINNTTIPVTKNTKYICNNCFAYLNYHLLIIK